MLPLFINSIVIALFLCWFKKANFVTNNTDIRTCTEVTC
jgi:hypothetical protein